MRTSFSVNMDVKMKERIEIYAKQHDISIAEFFRRLADGFFGTDVEKVEEKPS